MSDILNVFCAVAFILGICLTANYFVELDDRITAVEQRLDNRLFIPNITIGDNSQ